MALGEKLRKAREAKKQTASEVAAATRMKVQIVEDLEKEDFRRVAAPIYGKGFIRLYAEHVGLDPAPLITEYLGIHADGKTPSLISEIGDGTAPESAEQGPPAGEAAGAPDLFAGPEAEAGDERAPAETSPRPGESVPGPPAGKSRRRTPIVRPFLKKARERLRTMHGQAHEALGGIVSRVRIRLPDVPLKRVSVIVGLLIVVIFVISGLSRIIKRLPRTPDTMDRETEEALFLAEEPPEPYVD